MKATFKGNSIFFSPDLALRAGLAAGSRIFIFSIKGKNQYGFHKAGKDMEKSGILVDMVRSTPTGQLYVTPIAPPVSLIAASMRLSYKKQATVKVENAKVKDMNIFIFKK